METGRVVIDELNVDFGGSRRTALLGKSFMSVPLERMGSLYKSLGEDIANDDIVALE